MCHGSFEGLSARRGTEHLAALHRALQGVHGHRQISSRQGAPDCLQAQTEGEMKDQVSYLVFQLDHRDASEGILGMTGGVAL